MKASISIEKAAVMLGITPEELTAFCDRDHGQRYHHRTIYSGRIRFFAADIIRITKQLTQPVNVCTFEYIE